MSVFLMVVLVLAGGVAAYGAVVLGLTTPSRVAGRALRQNNQQMQNADHLMKRGGAFLMCGLVVLGFAALLLHQFGQL